MRNKYAGWRVPETTKAKAVDQLPVNELDADRLWSDYISKRKPVLIQGHLTDAGWTASAKWTNSYLASKAGSSRLQVEVRDGPEGSFGAGRKQPMSFKEFLDRMDQGDETLYLTTQPVPAAADGHPALWGEPLAHLTHDFVVKPELMGGLVPQQLNLWMGCARSGSSSGLHHDFHDNLYVLLRGRKRFRLWDPSRAAGMRTKGNIQMVHPNGRIVYEGQGDVLADGSSEQEAAAWAARAAAEARVAAAELAVQNKTQGAAGQLAAAEAALDQLLEAQLAAAIDAGGSPGGEDAWDNLQDDYVGDDSDDLIADVSSDDDDDGDDGDGMDDDDDEEQAGGQRRGLGQRPSKAGRKQGKQDDKAAATAQGGGGGGVTQEVEDPPSFCTGVDLSLPDAQLAKQYPGFPGQSAMMEVWVSAGQMLYLPAGWFHEVTSFNDEAAPGGGGAGAGGGTAAVASDQGGHMAFNYWFHPPDNLDPSPAAAMKPYKSDYWPTIWQARCKFMARSASPQSILVHRDSFDGVRVDEVDGATGHDPHRGPQHCFTGVKVDEVDGATGHDPHRGPGHCFDGVKVDEKDGACGHDPHRGPRHSFDGVKVDEVDGGTGHHGKVESSGAVAQAKVVVVEQGGLVLGTAAAGVEVALGGGAGGRKSSRKAGKPQRVSEHTVVAGGVGVVGLERWVPEEEGVQQDEAGDEAMDVDEVPGTRKGKGNGGQQGGEHVAAGKKRAGKSAPEEDEAAMEKGGEVEGKAKKKQKAGKKAEQEEEQEQEESEGLLEGEDGDMGEMVAKELTEYFSSQEGAGAFRLALGKYLLEAMAKEQAQQKKKRRSARSLGRRHHRVVRVPHPTADAAEDE